MAVTEVQLTVSQIKEDLDNGMTWFKKDDQGYGSIQEKYNAKDIHIHTIRKHPSLKNLEPNLVIFKIIDDESSSTKESKPTRSDTNIQPIPVSVECKKTDVGGSEPISTSDAGAATAFINL